MATNPRARIEYADDRHPWERQNGETERQYTRFCLFRDFGRTRSLISTRKLLIDLGDPLTNNTLRQNSWLYRWYERASHWDSHQDQQDAARVAEARRQMITRHQRTASLLLAKAVDALRNYATADLTPADMVRMIKLATDLELAINGRPTTTIAVTGPNGGPIQTEDLTGLTPEQRRARLQDVLAEIAARATINNPQDPDQ
jgi:hypothetical protein